MGMVRSWRRPMVGRDRDETHRASTPLELLFDLCFVVAVASAAAELHHALAASHLGAGLFGFATSFFAIWWAWVNFTWFASAYDTDDVPYRLLTLLQIAGVLVMAAGIPEAFEHRDFTVPTIGYVIMRVAMVIQWLRAAREHTAGRPAALRYALGISVVQLCWVVRLFLPGVWGWIGFGLFAVLELLVPVWAEYRGNRTSWHPNHIAERYGLFTLIVLGECVLSATTAIQTAISESGLSAALLVIAGSGLVLLFGLWWAYFKRDAAPRLRNSLKSTMVWAYSHYAVFGSVAAVGAGLGVVVDTEAGKTELPTYGAALAVAVPVVVYMVVVGLQHKIMNRDEPVALRYIVLGAVLILAAVLLPLPAAVAAMAVVSSLLVVYGVVVTSRFTL
ncbi:low temperature requirement protein LtrA [Actinocrispum wychmicini]|uniref:Low temperature requirement protein LtrA n=2 Tax=Actinocrispum wychmicini TaxID=1213861 RepID=A0A4R2K0E6_9PSEU|nr:low temperature requirement protein LtrA [Actinocrispum wychmicini]